MYLSLIFNLSFFVDTKILKCGSAAKLLTWVNHDLFDDVDKCADIF